VWEMKTFAIYNDPMTRNFVTEPWVYWDDGFTQDELGRLVDYCDSTDLVKGVTFGGENLETRNSNVCFFDRNKENAWIFDRLNFIIQSANEMFYGFQLDGYRTFQYTTYNDTEQGHYNWHMDMGMGTKETLLTRKLSLSLLLNDDFEGGEFHINNGSESNAITIPAKKGRAILFPSFMIHRVTPVTKGIRKSLVVWVLGQKFT
jgi:PKHD-type hydroxylase